MWPFKRPKAEFNDTEETEQSLRLLQNQARAHDMKGVYATLFTLNSRDKFGDPLVTAVVRGVIDLCALNDQREAIQLATYIINTTAKSAEFRNNVAEKALDIIERMAAPNSRDNAAIAMCCLLIVEGTAPGTRENTRGHDTWVRTVEALQKHGLEYAFAAASNAAVKLPRTPAPLRAVALDMWQDAVKKLAKDDYDAALKEILRVVRGYRDFGSGAADFRSRALDTLMKL